MTRTNLLQVATWFILGIAACSPAPERVAAPPSAPLVASQVMPTLVRVNFKNGIDTLAWAPDGIAVSESGTVLVTGRFGVGKNQSKHLFLFDTSRDSLLSFGPTGDGPGEFRGTAWLFAYGDTFAVYADIGRIRLEYSALGKYLGQVRVAGLGGWAFAASHDSVDLSRVQIKGEPGALPLLFWRQSWIDTKRRPLIAMTDSFVAQLGLHGTRGYRPALVPYAAEVGKMAIVEAFEYSFAIYNESGSRLYTVTRHLPPQHLSPAEIEGRTQEGNAMLKASGQDTELTHRQSAAYEKMAHDTIPRVYIGGVHYDGAGRLWIIGREGDSTFADAFADSIFLGRVDLSCGYPGQKIAVQGTWLGLLCHEDKRDSAPYRLQLYSIQEPLKKPE